MGEVGHGSWLELACRWSCAVGCDRRTVLVAGMAGAAQAEVRVVPVQRDCDISDLAGSNCPSSPIQVGAYLDRQWRIWRGLYRFDVAATIPEGAHVTSATLNLHSGAAGGEGMLTAHRVTTAWDEDVAWDDPWTTDGGDFASEGAGGYMRNSAWSAWDVTEVVDDWVNGRHPNYGLLVQWPDPEEGGGGGPEYMFYFTSAEAAGNRPYLEVNYEDRTGPDVELEGTLYEDRATQLMPDLYDLGIAADDTISDVDRAEVRLDGALVFTATPDLPCDEPTCNVDVDDYLLDATAFSGDHLFEVKAFDEAGNVTTIAWTANFDGVGEPFVPTDPEGEDPDGGMAGAQLGPTFALGCAYTTRSLAKGSTGLRTTGVRHGSWRDASGRNGPETTEFLTDGSYVLTRCTPGGELITGLWIAPVPVPGGETAMLPISRTLVTPKGYARVTAEYAHPEDPAFIAFWRTHRAAIERAVPDPTRLIP